VRAITLRNGNIDAAGTIPDFRNAAEPSLVVVIKRHPVAQPNEIVTHATSPSSLKNKLAISSDSICALCPCLLPL
jgi:hypothetical protein